MYYPHTSIEILFEILLRWGWEFLERMRILSGIQFATYFIEIFEGEVWVFLERMRILSEI